MRGSSAGASNGRRAAKIVLLSIAGLFGFLLIVGIIGAAFGLGKPKSAPAAAAASPSASVSPNPKPVPSAPAATRTSTKPTAAAPPADGGSYTDANTILTKLAAAGLVCAGPSQMSEDAAVLFDPGATSLITCDSPGGTAADTQVTVFDTAAHLDAYETQIESTVGYVSGGQLGGVNWVLESTPGYATKARAALGGRFTLIAAVSSPASTTQDPLPAPSTAQAQGCYPLTSGGNCYQPGEYCRTSDHGATGIDGDGDAIKCEDNNGWRWERV